MDTLLLVLLTAANWIIGGALAAGAVFFVIGAMLNGPRD